MAKPETSKQHTVGDVAKQAYDIPKERIGTSLFERVREIGLGSFGKGALIAGAIAVAVIALFAGFLGSEDALTVGRSAVSTFEGGAGHGISSALNFLLHPLGLAFMAAGGVAGVAGKMVNDQRKNAAEETKRMSLEYKRIHDQAHAQEQQKAQAQQAESERAHKSELEKEHQKQAQLEEKLKTAASDEREHRLHDQKQAENLKPISEASERLEKAASKLESAMAEKNTAKAEQEPTAVKAELDKVSEVAQRLEKAAASLERATEKLAAADKTHHTSPAKAHHCPPREVHLHDNSNYLDQSQTHATANVFNVGNNPQAATASVSIEEKNKPTVMAAARLNKPTGDYRQALTKERLEKAEASPDLGMSS